MKKSQQKRPYNAPNIEIKNTISPEEFERYAVVYGAKCAGWLVRRHGCSMKRFGRFEVFVPKGVVEPIWFRLAMRHLRKAKTFKVRLLSQPTQLTYEVTWLRWYSKGAIQC